MAFVEIAVNSGLPHHQSFSYAVPTGMTLVPGDAVYVPFGRRLLQGIVLEVVEVPAFAEPKLVESLLGDRPVVSPERVQLARWIAQYYLSPLFPAVSLMLPPGFEQRPLTYYESLVTPDEIDTLPLPPRQREVLLFIGANGRVEVKEMERALVRAHAHAPLRTSRAVATSHENASQQDPPLRPASLSAALSQLVQRGLIVRSNGLARPSVRAKTMRYIDLIASNEAVDEAADEFDAERKRGLAKALRLLLDAGGTLTASELRLRAGVSLPALRPLMEAALIEVRDERVERDPLAGRGYEAREGPPLTAEQARAFGEIRDALRRTDRRTPLILGKPKDERDVEAVAIGNVTAGAQAFLLHGVTGSGKTEVYLRALEEAVALGKRGIVLVPEIALTPQTVRRFAERFPGQVAVLHSGLSQGELFDQWNGIRDGRYAVVIGSRSAVFAPQPELGLIVIDEEHEWTYKQQDQAPRYEAREAALKLAELTGAVIVMGSATPDVVSYQRALWGRYRLLELRERVRPVFSGPNVVGITSTPELPPVDVVDMREELKGGNRSIFSRSLQLGLYQALDKGEQTILFLNRRGSAGFLQCRDCGFVPQCSSCAIALSYHRHLDSTGAEMERLLCHQCNRARLLLERCPMCGGARLRPMGLGVERVEEAVHEAFPEVRTLRWDRDVTQGRHSHEQILSSFLNGEADVLVGTQMVAKGLDLPAVTLVGVISADIGLHIPDFRSAERTFQLLTQVAGRAGRAAPNDGGPPPGRVVIQTYTPDNYAIVAAAQHDYASFFAAEIELRRQEAYPPFVRLARLIFSHTNPAYGERQAERMVRELKRDVSHRGLPGVEVLGPAPPHVPKWHGRYRWQVTVRSPDPAELLRDVRLDEGWVLDIDPASLA